MLYVIAVNAWSRIKGGKIGWFDLPVVTKCVSVLAVAL